MKLEADHKQLLAEVMAEGAPADFREEMLTLTLRTARQRRRGQQVRQVMLALIACSLIVFWTRRSPTAHAPHQVAAITSETPAPYELVHTQPLATTAMVVTQPLVTEAYGADVSPVALVRTTAHSSALEVINDAELLALVEQRPAILVQTGPTSELLVFANPDDEKGFPVN